jgi:hypothetical protein
MTRRLMILITGGLAMLVAGHAAAHDRYRVIGPVVEMDQKNNVLKVKTSEKGYPPVVEIDITPKTRIERDGKPVPRTAIKRGLHVVVDALGDDVFGLEAVTIRIVPAPK